MRAVLIASGEPHPNDARWLADADLVIAVDGGAAWLADRGVHPDALVGDLDSVSPGLVTDLEAAGVAVERHPTEKDTSDTELALAYARRHGADEVVVIGAFGGPRLDHELANVLLLAAATNGGEVRLVRDTATVAVVRAQSELEIAGPPGTIVSLFPIDGDAAGVTTTGLAYRLRDEALTSGSTRGLSNLVTASPASVRLRRGALLVVEQLTAGKAPEGETQ